MDADPLWYQDAIIYQLHVRAFHDSNNDGVGDFAGLTQKLDYLQRLGVNALWLLPFYPSPLKDDGYDIANYTDVNPGYGTMQDFQAFLDGAHRRGMRVITELVMNHTSDQHAWFQKARSAPPGSPERDFYVWSDTSAKFEKARVIFQDYEPSNWTWDGKANAYFWHRFFHHQPDLNFENPDVREAMTAALDFWLERGVDGLRLDAVPYLFERDGTTCENLPETHSFLRAVRRHIDERYPNRMLLAEANQWPEDAAAYFGDGDECHMAFHFPVMPRLFMAVQREDRFPIIDILQQTPPIPPNCQWTMFLRNHDELTLEMVTDEERDYMYRVYADDPRARVNLGIRRRLAPLMKNSRRLIELLNGLLFTLPGTPVVYYGDELGMGDNIYLGDRDAVRTPMQWNGDRNAGFSRANPQRLFLPVIVDPEFHYSTINVEAQEANPNSLLWWMRRLIGLRKRSRVFGRGSLEFLLPDNPKVLAFIRQYDGETVLVVANLSRYAQYVELDLSRFEGHVPTEAFGKTHFPPIGELPYMLTLAEYAFHLFTLSPRTEAVLSIAERSLPTERIAGHWEDIFSDAAVPRLESAVPRFLKQQPWFLGADDTIRSVKLEASLPLRFPGNPSFGHLCLLSVEFLNRDSELYAVPFAWTTGDEASDLIERHSESVLLRLLVGQDSQSGVLHDALGRPTLLYWWQQVLRHPAIGSFEDAEMVATGFERPGGELLPEDVHPQIHAGRVSYTWARLGDVAMLRLFQRFDPESSPSVEMNRFLRRHAPEGLVPPWLGAIELARPGYRTPITLAELTEFVPNHGTAWIQALDHLQQFFEHVATLQGGVAADPSRAATTAVDDSTVPIADEGRSIWELRELPPPRDMQGIPGFDPVGMKRMGERTAELHAALSSVSDDPAFATQDCTAYYKRSMFQSLRSIAARSFQRLGRLARRLPAEDRETVERFLEREPAVMRVFQQLLESELNFQRIRCHGNYTLHSLLFTGNDYMIYDFRGNVEQSVGERRLKRPALRDVAGMIWSLESAAETALTAQEQSGKERAALQRWEELWFRWSAAAFLDGYFTTASEAALVGPAATHPSGVASFLPARREESRTLLKAELFRISLGDLAWELDHTGQISPDVIVGLDRLFRTT